MQHLDDVLRDIPKQFADQYGDLLRRNPFLFDMYFNNFLCSRDWDVFPAPFPEQAKPVVVKSFEETVRLAYPMRELPSGSLRKLADNVSRCLSVRRVLIPRPDSGEQQQERPRTLPSHETAKKPRRRNKDWLRMLDSGVRELGPQCSDEQLIQWVFKNHNGEYPDYFLGKPEVVQTWRTNKRAHRRFEQDASKARTGR